MLRESGVFLFFRLPLLRPDNQKPDIDHMNQINNLGELTSNAMRDFAAANKLTGDNVEHPPHYGGKDNAYEAIKVIEAWDLGFCLGNTLKYICRAGAKDNYLEDLKKARWYLDHEIESLEHPVDTLYKEVVDHSPEKTPALPGLEEVEEEVEFNVNPHVYPRYTPAGAYCKEEHIRHFNYLAEVLYANALKKGFWDSRSAIVNTCGSDSPDLAKAAQVAVDCQAIVLIMSELGEAVEGIRKDAPDDHLPQYKSVEVELADAIIRIMEYSHGRSWRIFEALFDKMEYNSKREHMHGKNC